MGFHGNIYGNNEGIYHHGNHIMQHMEMEEILHQLIGGLAHYLHINIGVQPSKVAQGY
jgi:hypothetical protein